MVKEGVAKTGISTFQKASEKANKDLIEAE